MFILRFLKTTVRIFAEKRQDFISSALQTLHVLKTESFGQVGRELQESALHGLWWMVRALSDVVRSPQPCRQEVSGQYGWKTIQSQFVSRDQEMRYGLCKLSLLKNPKAAL